MTGNAFGLSVWIVFTVWALFDNLMEAPFGAIPFYLLCGTQLAPLLRRRNDQREAAAPSPVAPAVAR